MDEYRTSRITYIIEADLEYLISLLITGAYLAKICAYIDVSDGVTGILTSVVSIGSAFQLLSLFSAGGRRVKRRCVILQTINQLCFALLYVVPLLKAGKTTLAIAFTALLYTGYIIAGIIAAPKMNWMMALVDNDKRGEFTANKEIVSLLSGMIYVTLIGAMLDRFEANGKIADAFAIFAGIILVLTALHTLTLILTKEKPPRSEKRRVSIKELLSNRAVVRVMLAYVIWNAAAYASTPFFGSYQIGALGFSMTFISILSVAYSIVRALVSRKIGRLADRKSYAVTMSGCFVIAAAAYAVNVFTVPQNGRVLYTIYYVLYAVSMAGINGGMFNLVFDYVPAHLVAGALALQSSAAGIAGFLSTALCSRIVEYVQRNGNRVFGVNMYAQQLLSAFTAIAAVGMIFYMRNVVGSMKKVNSRIK